MNDEPKEYTGLCIGGPHDGKLVTRSHPSFRTLILDNRKDYDPDMPSEMPLTKEVTYIHESISTPDRVFYFWHPMDVTLTRCVEMLLADYGQSK